MKVKQEKQEKGSRDRPGDGCPWEVGEIQGRSREDPGKIHRSKGFGVQGCWRKYGKGSKGRCGCGEHGVGIRARRRTGKEWGEDGTRTIEFGGVLWESNEERRGEV